MYPRRAGNGWAAAGMLRVLATIQNSGNDTLANEFKSQSQDLAAWVKEIVDAAWGMPQASCDVVEVSSWPADTDSALHRPTGSCTIT